MLNSLLLLKNQGMSTSASKYLRELDRQIKHEYQQICFNSSRREMLLRLISNDQKVQPIDSRFTSQLLDNRIITQYIRGVYERYGIEDPIKKELRFATRNATETTPEKSANVTQLTDSDKLTRTKRKLLNLKDSFKRDSQDIVFSSQFTHNQTERGEVIINPPKINKEIGYRTKQKIRFKTIANDKEIEHSPAPIMRPILLPEQKKLRYSNAAALCKSAEAIFRFCPMCEQIILEENIQFHEEKCKQLQESYQMPYSQFQALIISKVKRMQGQIYHQIFKKKEEDLLAEYADLKSSIKLWLDRSVDASFEQIHQKFDIFSLDLLERITKLNWFRNLLAKIAGERAREAFLK